jgi:hypothetical protein
MRVRASDEKITSFAAMFRDSLFCFVAPKRSISRYRLAARSASAPSGPVAFDDVESALKRVA